MNPSSDPDGIAPDAAHQAAPIEPPSPSDERLFRDLVQEHSSRLQRFIIRHIGNISEAEDIAQQAFTEAARSYRTFRGESQLSTWLYGIALNLIRNHLSRAPERRYDFVGDSGLDDLAADEPRASEDGDQTGRDLAHDRLRERQAAGAKPAMRRGLDDARGGRNAKATKAC